MAAETSVSRSTNPAPCSIAWRTIGSRTEATPWFTSVIDLPRCSSIGFTFISAMRPLTCMYRDARSKMASPNGASRNSCVSLWENSENGARLLDFTFINCLAIFAD